MSSLIETEDKRIACVCNDNSIAICSFDLINKRIIREIYKKNAHDKDNLYSLSSVPGNRLVSTGDLYDCSFRIWNLTTVSLNIIKVIKNHINAVLKVIPLTNGRIASCSSDNTVKIWKDDSECTHIITLQTEESIGAMLQLKGKEVLVSCGNTDC